MNLQEQIRRILKEEISSEVKYLLNLADTSINWWIRKKLVYILYD
jgi:hypothetical protein